jgi:uncharacterized protein (TIGR01777 family)
MRIIITGGTGLIGRALSKSLIQAEHEVFVLSRNPASHSDSFLQGIRAVAWDGRTAEGWGKLVDGADVIVNLAGESIAGDSMASLITKRWSPARLKSILQSRLSASEAITNAIRSASRKPAILVQASAVGYYGSRGDQILTEESSPGSDKIADICKDWERSTDSIENMGVRRIMIRTAGVVLSTSGGAFPFMMLPFKFYMGGPLGSGKNWFSWIHISDEVKAIRFLIEKPEARGAYNLCSPQSIPNREFSKILGQVMRRPSKIPMPAFALYLLFGEKASILLASQRQTPKRLMELGFRFDFPDVEPALRDLLQR